MLFIVTENNETFAFASVENVYADSNMKLWVRSGSKDYCFSFFRLGKKSGYAEINPVCEIRTGLAGDIDVTPSVDGLISEENFDEYFGKFLNLPREILVRFSEK